MIKSINGIECTFVNFDINHANYIMGGNLESPCKIMVGSYTLNFKSLYLFVDNERIYGGELNEEHTLSIGKIEFPVTEVYFYYDSDDVDSITLAVDVEVTIGDFTLILTTKLGYDVTFHPNGDIMSCFLKESTCLEIYGYTIHCQSIGFGEGAKVSGVVPFYDAELNVNGNSYIFEGGHGDPTNCIYTISFNQNGQIDKGTLTDGRYISF
ncbi:hypothetical protein [Flavobacterium aciduliphilum]|uniref:Uncharacterized protein n=1 Tax=Flavobacterium aciduliphilum TaxID=1101402 RepID=A0A328YI83_9FLAO|nr:hypothetical protein [Flavobacterium aciduliphilum]RAR73818.1 hypothetical protein CLV55_103137 [Flavobacterium aciduliphilum]